jgi:hypothetical protein
MAAQQHPVVYSFIRIHYLSSFVGPVALKSSFANFRQLYRITETTLLVFDAAGRVVGRHANITNIGDLYRTLYEDYQLIAANPGPVGGQTNIVPGPRHITSPIPHPLEAEVATTAMPALAALPPHATYRGSGPAIGQYTIINANLPGLRAYKPETNETHPASVIMGLYPTQPRLVAALQALRTQTSLPCYTFMASNEYGTPFYILSVGAFSTPDEAWEQITTAIPSATPVCVGILIQP